MYRVKPLDKIYTEKLFIFYMMEKISHQELVIATPIEVTENSKLKTILGSKPSASSLTTFLNGSVNQHRNILCTK